MRVCGIVAEYNPFHNGHKYLIEELKKLGSTHVVAVMSGNVAQRGEFSYFNKWTKTKAALSGGVDLVIELPSVYACSSAERFASGAVKILDALGCVDTIGFGSECGDISLLEKAASFCEEAIDNGILCEKISQGLSYPRAFEAAVAEYSKSASDLLKNPNNVLGIEYIKAIKRTRSGISPITVKRIGPPHNYAGRGENITGQYNTQYANASFIRNLLNENKSIDKYVPAETLNFYESEKEHGIEIDMDSFDKILLYKLKTTSIHELLNTPDVSEGLENRIYRAAQKANTMQDFYLETKTKRYTMARIRRITLNLLVGITKSDLDLIPYIRVLGSNQKGINLLAKIRKSAGLRISPSLKQLCKNNGRFAEIETLVTKIRALGCRDPYSIRNEYQENIIIFR